MRLQGRTLKPHFGVERRGIKPFFSSADRVPPKAFAVAQAEREGGLNSNAKTMVSSPMFFLSPGFHFCRKAFTQ